MTEEELFEDPVVKYPITVSLESCKSKFFTDDSDGFYKEITSGKFTVYHTTYNYNDDYDGRPDFIVKNLLNGFPRQLEDKRKYLFTVFRCTKLGDKYNITATWITNCTLSMDQLIPNKYADFAWSKMDLNNNNNIDAIIKDFHKNEDDSTVVIVSYLH